MHTAESLQHAIATCKNIYTQHHCSLHNTNQDNPQSPECSEMYRI